MRTLVWIITFITAHYFVYQSNFILQQFLYIKEGHGIPFICLQLCFILWNICNKLVGLVLVLIVFQFASNSRKPLLYDKDLYPRGCVHGCVCMDMCLYVLLAMCLLFLNLQYIAGIVFLSTCRSFLSQRKQRWGRNTGV